MSGIDNYTKLTSHCDGINGGTTFTDSSDGNNIIIATNVVTRTEVNKFGGSSAYFNGTNSYLNFGISSNYNFYGGPFTLDFWIYRVRSNIQEILLCSGPSSTVVGPWGIYISFENKLCSFPRGYQAGYGPLLTGSTSITQNAWHHVAVTFNGTTYRMFLDGVLDSSAVLTPYSNSNYELLFGINSADYSSYCYVGYMDELRVSNGVARWTSNFTPPMSEYSKIIYSITGNVSEDSKIVVYSNLDDLLLASSVKQAGSYIIDTLPNQNKVNVLAIPTSSGIAPKVEVGITPISSE